MDKSKKFRTLRRFFRGDESDEGTYFAYSATLRIFGVLPDLQVITDTLGVKPMRALHKGDRLRPRSPPLTHDRWHYRPDVSETEPLEVHINALWVAIKDHSDFIKNLKRRATVDVFLGYRSICESAGFEVPHTCLKLFVELEIPFEVSIIIA